MEQKSDPACFTHDVLIYTVQNISLESINGLSMRTYGWETAGRKINVYETSKGVNVKKDCLGGLEKKEEDKTNGMK